MKYVSLGNPIWSGQLAMLGGWRRVFWTTGSYGLILFAGCITVVKASDPDRRTDGAAWALNVLPYIQLGLLFAVGSSARLKAMTRDHQSLMSESIRMSPMRAGMVVLGYMFGPLTTTLISWLLGVLAGLGLIVFAGLGDSSGWLAGNGLMLIAAMAAWSLQVFLGVGPKKPSNAIFVLYVMAFIAHTSAQSQALLMAPGFALLTGVHAATISIPVMDGALEFSPGLAIGLTASLVMTLFWCWAAARRFRRPDRPALSIFGALILFVLGAVFGIISISNVDTIYAGSPLLRGDIVPGMSMALCGIMLILMAFPISSAIQMHRIGILSLPDPSQRARSWVFPVSFFALLVSVVTIGWVIGSVELSDYRLVNSVLIVTAACLTFYGVLYRMCLTTGSTNGAWSMLAAYWIIPVLLAVVWHGAQVAREVRDDGDSLGALFSVSPIGALIATWTSVQAPIRVGIVAQFVIAIIAVLMGLTAQRAFRRVRASVLAAPTVEPVVTAIELELEPGAN